MGISAIFDIDGVVLDLFGAAKRFYGRCNDPEFSLDVDYYDHSAGEIIKNYLNVCKNHPEYCENLTDCARDLIIGQNLMVSAYITARDKSFLPYFMNHPKGRDIFRSSPVYCTDGGAKGQIIRSIVSSAQKIVPAGSFSMDKHVFFDDCLNNCLQVASECSDLVHFGVLDVVNVKAPGVRLEYMDPGRPEGWVCGVKIYESVQEYFNDEV